MATAESVSRDAAPVALPGVGRALVLAGKLTQKVAEDTFKKARAGQKNFISELIGSGAIAGVSAVASFITEAGFMASVLRWLTSGALPSSFWTRTATALPGMPARARLASSGAGSVSARAAAESSAKTIRSGERRFWQGGIGG